MSTAVNGSEPGGMGDEERLRMIIVDDDPLARRVLRDVLQAAGITVIAEAASGREALELSGFYKPDLVLMDVVMPEMDGIAATRALVRRHPEVCVVVLTATDDEHVGLAGLRAGASGFLCKTIAPDALPRALRGALAGQAVVSRELTMRLVSELQSARENGIGMRPVRSPLTSRQWEVLDLLCQSRSTQEIADSLVLSTETVRSHVKSLLRKLGVSSRDQAVREAARMRADLSGSVDVAA